MSRETVATDKGPAAVGPYSQGVKVGNTLYCSGQIPLNTAGDIVSDDIAVQAKQVLENVKALVEAAGGSLRDVVKATMFLVDLNDFQTVNGIYAEYFDQNPPARSTIQVAALPKGAKIEIEIIAILGSGA